MKQTSVIILLYVFVQHDHLQAGLAAKCHYCAMLLLQCLCSSNSVSSRGSKVTLASTLQCAVLNVGNRSVWQQNVS